MYKWAGKRIFVHVFCFSRTSRPIKRIGNVHFRGCGKVAKRHGSKSPPIGWHFRPEDPHRQMTAPRHQNLHFSREIRPPPPNDGAKGEKSAYLSGNSTPLRQLSWLAEGGGIVKSCLTSALFGLPPMA